MENGKDSKSKFWPNGKIFHQPGFFFEIRELFPFSYQPFLGEGPDNLTRKNVCRIFECIRFDGSENPAKS